MVTSYNKTLDEWTLSGEYSFFISDYARENFDQFLAWEWQVNAVGADPKRAKKVISSVAE